MSLLKDRLMATNIDIPKQAPATIIVIIKNTLSLEETRPTPPVNKNT